MINENENEAENENMSRRYDINRPKPRHGHKYTKCKMGQSIQEWAKGNLWKTAFKKFYLVHS